MSMSRIGLAATILAGALLTGCASKPKPTPVGPSAAATPLPPSSESQATPQQPGGSAAMSVQEAFAAAAGDRVYFALDSEALSEQARAVLRDQATWLKRRPDVRVQIAGHADERGTREYNLALGARRATSVRAYLIGEGISADRIETISFGKERPLDPGSGEEAWARNRNAHTVVLLLGSS